MPPHRRAQRPPRRPGLLLHPWPGTAGNSSFRRRPAGRSHSRSTTTKGRPQAPQNGRGCGPGVANDLEVVAHRAGFGLHLPPPRRTVGDERTSQPSTLTGGPSVQWGTLPLDRLRTTSWSGAGTTERVHSLSAVSGLCWVGGWKRLDAVGPRGPRHRGQHRRRPWPPGERPDGRSGPT